MTTTQSTNKQVWSVKKLNVGAGNLTPDSTGNLLASAGLKISNKLLLTADSTGLVVNNTISALPGNVSGGANKIVFIVNSTGVFQIGINTTGTTWLYLNTTSISL